MIGGVFAGLDVVIKDGAKDAFACWVKKYDAYERAVAEHHNVCGNNVIRTWKAAGNNKHE